MERYEAGGWWLPDGEEHLQQWLTTVNRRVAGPGGEIRQVYQFHKYQAAQKYLRGRRHAIDVGAHVGLWSWFLAQDFKEVRCFEPVEAHRDCWHRNLALAPNAHLLPFALGAETGWARIKTRTPGSSGDTGIDPAAESSSLRATIVSARRRKKPYMEDGEEIEVRTLDSFQLQDIDFLKVDCEGYELFVLQGGKETLLRCRPCLIVEQKPETGMEQRYGVKAADCIAFLQGLGAKLRTGIQGDYIFSWDQ